MPSHSTTTRVRQSARRLLRQRGVDIVRYPGKFTPVGDLRDLLRHKGVDLVVDIGANVGQYYRFLRDEVDYSGPIGCVEPSATAIDALRTLTSDDPNATVIPVAVGAADGTALLNQYGEGGSSQLNSMLDASAVGMEFSDLLHHPTATEEVEVWTTDRVFDLLSQRFPSTSIALKVDTQGFDLAVLEGLQRWRSSVQVLQLELPWLNIYENAPGFFETLHAAIDLGFGPVGFHKLHRDRKTRQAIEFDCVMVRI